MPNTTRQDLINFWDEFLLNLKSLQKDNSYENFVRSEAFEDFTSMIIPADIVDDKLYLYCSYEEAERHLYSPRGKYHDILSLFSGIRNKGFEINELFIVYRHPGIDKKAYYSIKDVMEMIEELKKLYTQRSASELYNSTPSKLGIDNIISVEDVSRKRPKGKIIKQSNKLNTAGYNLTLTQKKALIYCIRKFQNSKSMTKDLFNSVSFDVALKDFKDAGIGNNVVQIKKNLLPILGANVRMEQNDSFVAFNIFERFSYDEKVKEYKITFTPSFTAFINQTAIHQEYTKINSEVVLACNSYYTTRMYELCCQYRNSKNLILVIDDDKLKFILNCQDKYSQSSDFQKRVLDVAQKELDKMFKEGRSDITFTIKGVAKSRNEKIRRKTVSKWLINIKSKILFDDSVNTISYKEKEEICDITVRQIYDKFHLCEDLEANIAYEKFTHFDFNSKIKATRELQFRLNEIVDDKCIFADVINSVE